MTTLEIVLRIVFAGFVIAPFAFCFASIWANWREDWK